MSDQSSSSAAHLLEHREFVYRIALALVHGPAEAEDLAQEAWLAAVRTPPRASSRAGIRSWFKRVVQNSARQHLRGSGRRRAREEASARGEAISDSTQSIERLEFHEALVQRVLRLPEPLRSTIVLRYLEDHSSAEVAQRMNVPENTVHMRLRKALARLRNDLDEAAGGDRSAWAAILIPTVHASSAAGSPTLTGLAGTLITMKLGITLTLAALALTVWILRSDIWSGDATEPPSAIVEAARLPALAYTPDSDLERGTSGTGSRIEVAQSAEDAGRPDDDTRLATTPSSRSVEVEGIVELVELDGSINKTSDGYLLIGSQKDQAGTQVPVTNGTFHYSWNSPRSLEVRGGFLAGSGATNLTEQSLDAGESVARLVLQRTPDWTLHVLDAMTLQELRGVEVREVDGWEAGLFSPSGETWNTTLVNKVDSPVQLRAGLGRRPYWVRAEGYAWSRKWINHDTEHQMTVMLEPGATLNVWCEPSDISPRMRVRLYPGNFDGNDPVCSVLTIASDGPTVFESIPAGKYQLRAEIGEFYEPPTCFALKETKVLVGEVVDVHLKLDRTLAGAKPAPLAGTLVLPADMPIDGMWLELMRATGTAIQPGDQAMVRLRDLQTLVTAGEYRFDFGKVTPGRVKFGLMPLRRSWVVELTEAGNRQVRLNMGDLAEVEVEVRNALNGSLLAADGISWSPWPGGIWQVEDPEPNSIAERAIKGFEIIYQDPETLIARFLAPVGTLHMGCWLEGYGEAGQEEQVVAGVLNHISLALTPVATLLVGFVDAGGQELDLGGFDLERVDEPGGWEHVRNVGLRRQVTLEQGGHWRVKSAPEGWTLMGPAEISIKLGERLILEAVVRKQ